MPQPQAKLGDSRDMTTGSVAKKLILFALPVLGGSIFTQLYNVVDSIVVGQYEGAAALASVGTSMPINMLCNSVFMGLGTGSSVLVSQFYGAKQNDELNKMVNTTYTLALIIGTIITVLGMLIARPILELLNTPANMIENATIYLRIVFFGSLGHLFYQMGSAVLRGLGDSKWPMYFLIICSVLNIILDLLFVVAFHWGVAGVAWATIIAQLISGIGVVIRTLKGGYGVRINLKTLRIDGHKALLLAKIGIPSALSMLISSMGMLVIQRFNNGFGSDFVAGMTIMMKVDGFALIPMQALGMAVTTFVGQNMGAGKDDRVHKGVRTTMILIIAMGAIMGAIMYFFGYQLGAIFTKEEAAKEVCMIGLRIVFIMYIAMGLQQAFQGIMRGAGAATVPMVIALVCMLVRIPAAYLLAVRPDNFRGIFYSMIISSYLGAILLYVYYKMGGWKKHVAVRRGGPAGGPGGPGGPGGRPGFPGAPEVEEAIESAEAEVATQAALAADGATAAEVAEFATEIAEAADLGAADAGDSDDAGE